MVKPGDEVVIRTDEETFEGVYLEKPRLLEQDTIILKLSTGYNIGINKNSIKNIKVVKPYRKPQVRKKDKTQDKSLPKVAILSTGGTISSKVDYNTGGVIAAYTAEDFIEMCPEILEIAQIRSKKVSEIMSEDVTFEDISNMAKMIKDELKTCDGVVVSTGTDMLGYIAAGLSFLLKPNKPVIITAAQKSIDRGSSDAFFNLVCATKAASSYHGKEVVTCLHGVSSDEYCSLIRGTRVRKMHTSRRDAFRSINENILAKVYGKDKIDIINDQVCKKRDRCEITGDFEKKVGIVYVYPNMDARIFENYKDYRGIIIMGTGLGHIPNNCIPKIKELSEKGIFVAMTSQCIYGRVSETVYSALRKINIEGGVTYLGDMLAETALMKLAYVLNQEQDPKKVKEIMKTDLAGEISSRIEYDTFLK